MASAGLRAELECSICLDIYKDPVTLKCGHNFCRDCIHCVRDTQEESGGFSCPECREKFQDWPALQRNMKLRNIVENFHNKSPEHILTDPTSSMESRKCSVHKEMLKYFCTEDDICVCMSCFVIGEHKGHKMESLDEASEKKKKKLRNVLQKLLTKREEMEEGVQSLQEMIQDLEIKKDELSRNMRHIEELCNMTNPLTVLQESDTGALCDTEDGDDEDRERHDRLLHDGGDLDVAGILHTGLSDIIRQLKEYFHIDEAADILLDIDTACNKLEILDDNKTAIRSDIIQKRLEIKERFKDYAQVLSIQKFSSGRHYWEVDVGGSDMWRVGMCYPSMDRKVFEAGIGRNNKSWGLLGNDNHYAVRHDSNEIRLPSNLSSNRVRISVDYEAGRISFYNVCNPIRHLHTFTTTFTEPLHVVLCAAKGCIKICGGKSGDVRTPPRD